jgi:hypothetical protein
MSLEEYTEVVDMLAFMNANQTIMNIRLHGSIAKNTLREWVSICSMSYAACGHLHLVCFGACG